MTTLAQVKKVAKQRFIPTLEAHGFKHIKTMDFLRRRPDYIHDVIALGILRGGGNLRASVDCWVPELDPEIDPRSIEKVPPPAISSGGDLGFDRISFGGRLWNVSREADIGPALDAVLDQVERIALPWFAAIESREKLVEALVPEVRNQPDFEQVRQAILQKTHTPREEGG